MASFGNFDPSDYVSDKVPTTYPESTAPNHTGESAHTYPPFPTNGFQMSGSPPQSGQQEMRLLSPTSMAALLSSVEPATQPTGELLYPTRGNAFYPSAEAELEAQFREALNPSNSYPPMEAHLEAQIREALYPSAPYPSAEAEPAAHVEGSGYPNATYPPVEAEPVTLFEETEPTAQVGEAWDPEFFYPSADVAFEAQGQKRSFADIYAPAEDVAEMNRSPKRLRHSDQEGDDWQDRVIPSIEVEENGLDPELFEGGEVQYLGSRERNTAASEYSDEDSQAASSSSDSDEDGHSNHEDTEVSQNAAGMSAVSLPGHGFATSRSLQERQEMYGHSTGSREDPNIGFSGLYQHASSTGGEVWSGDGTVRHYPPEKATDNNGPDALPMPVPSPFHGAQMTESKKKSRQGRPLQVWRDEEESVPSGQNRRNPSGALREITNLPSVQLRSSGAPAEKGRARRQPQSPEANTGHTSAPDHTPRKRKATEDLAHNGVRKQKLVHNQPSPVPSRNIESGPGNNDDVAYYTPASISGGSGHVIKAIPSGAPDLGDFNILPGYFAPEVYNPEDVDAYVAYLGNQVVSAEQLRPEDKQYVPIPPVSNPEEFNDRLTDFLSDDGPVPRMFRDYPVPDPDDMSLFARCVRFAQSHAQRGINWKAHPFHVHDIMQRTNGYGLELLRSRTKVPEYRCVTAQSAFNVMVAYRWVHTLSPESDFVNYVASDIMNIVKFLGANPVIVLRDCVESQELAPLLDVMKPLIKRIMADPAWSREAVQDGMTGGANGSGCGKMVTVDDGLIDPALF